MSYHYGGLHPDLWRWLWQVIAWVPLTDHHDIQLRSNTLLHSTPPLTGTGFQCVSWSLTNIYKSFSNIYKCLHLCMRRVNSASRGLNSPSRYWFRHDKTSRVMWRLFAAVWVVDWECVEALLILAAPELIIFHLLRHIPSSSPTSITTDWQLQWGCPGRVISPVPRAARLPWWNQN